MLEETQTGVPATQRLTKRELEVLGMAARGFTNNQVAGRLEISVHAVKFHLASIYRKLGVINRTEAAVVYLRSQQSRSPRED